jgi:hypothetical protein
MINLIKPWNFQAKKEITQKPHNFAFKSTAFPSEYWFKQVFSDFESDPEAF